MSTSHQPATFKRTVRALSEDAPGPAWKGMFDASWPSYRAWFLAEGDGARPQRAEAAAKLRQFMPELFPVYEKLVALAGGGDHVARMLSLHCPTPYLAGCSQIVWTRGEPFLIRNYDYRPDLWEATVLRSRWLGRDVIAMSDCLWGALDGMNADGLVVSLTFGGRRVVGEGFGIPLVLRYILETCTTAKDAARVLHRTPAHMAYNVSVLDREGDYLTAHVGPGGVSILPRWPVSTNHQETIDWNEYVEATASLRREALLAECWRDPHEDAEKLKARFFQPPLYSREYRRGRGTIYTAVYRPTRGDVVFMWPGKTMHQSFAGFRETRLDVLFANAADHRTTA